MTTPPQAGTAIGSDFAGLRALFFNCTLKKSPTLSNTDGVIELSTSIMLDHGVEVDVVRAVDHDLAPGVYPDMTEYGWDTDEWPSIWPRVESADIVVIAGPIWLGDNSSVTRRVIERLYAHSSDVTGRGQYVFYGKVGSAIITGNEDGVKHCAAQVLFGLQHIGFTIPPGADTGWLGPIGPGPSYLDPGSGGADSTYTNRTATYMTWNLMHMASMIKGAGGIPAYGNTSESWRQAGGFASDEDA